MPTLGSKFPSRLWASCGTVLYSYRTPKLMVRSLVARQPSWKNPEYAQLRSCNVGSPTVTDDLKGAPAKKSSRELDAGGGVSGGPAFATPPRNVMLPRALPYAAFLTLL